MINCTQQKIFQNEITCPNCGKHYELKEIFLPSEVFNGNLCELYTCEQCEMPFKVELQLKYRTDNCVNKLIFAIKENKNIVK